MHFFGNIKRVRDLKKALKEGPTVVVLTVTNNEGSLSLTVCPVTSQRPATEADFVEIPGRVKIHLGLTDRDKSYIVRTEVNRFTWPGPDVRPIDLNGKSDVVFGRIPEHLLDRIKDSMIANIRKHRLKSTPRAP